MIAARVCGAGALADAVTEWLEAEHYAPSRSPSVDHAIGAIDPDAPGAGAQALIVLVEDAADDLPRLLAAWPGACVVIVLAQASVARTVQLMQQGARSVVCTRATFVDQLVAVLSVTQPEAVRPRWTPSERAIFGSIVTRSPGMAAIMEQIRSVARSPDTTVVIFGESGTGKELVALATHQLSLRAKRPMIAVNCGAIPEALFESELFGHERGAFSGATEDRKGRLELADGGTIFLDEIGELPLAMQAKLLRVLEDRQVWRVGARAPRPVDVRVIAASNRDLRTAVERGQFRADLFFRINVFPIALPPLRERGADVLHLAQHFFDQFNQHLERGLTGLTSAARARLVDYDYPGNIRELRNIMELAAITAEGPMVEARDIVLPCSGGRTTAVIGGVQLTLAFGERGMENLERAAMVAALQRAGGNQTRAAQLLGIQRLA
ncbi:MAG TPA: sigma-54 dependent transcriptional regulator, partial [Kofleriaceae bacterium]|nr:sigma-54 dependent transcriptional regulator [Kofleriaceae bacterium]